MRYLLAVSAALAIALGAALLGGLVPATANHVPGGTYYGTQTWGGAVELVISPDGSGVASFKAFNVPGDFCTFEEIGVEFTSHPAIVNHSFSYQVGTGLS